jgi:hypothetical protein
MSHSTYTVGDAKQFLANPNERSLESNGIFHEVIFGRKFITA